MDNKSPVEYSFIGEVSDPFCSPRITKGLVEFSVKATKTSPFVPEKGAELIDQDGHSYPVTIRSVGRITPDPALDKWRPGDTRPAQRIWIISTQLDPTMVTVPVWLNGRNSHHSPLSRQRPFLSMNA